jgi:hypothetical protein
MKDVESTGPTRQDLGPSHWQRTRLRLASRVRERFAARPTGLGPRRQEEHQYDLLWRDALTQTYAARLAEIDGQIRALGGNSE